MFGGSERLYMYNERVRNIFLNRFSPVLEQIISDLHQGRYTTDDIIKYYSSINILDELELIRRYNYRIEILDDNLEDKKKYEKEKTEGETEEELEGESEGELHQ